MTRHVNRFIRSLACLAGFAITISTAGCGGCEGDPGKSVFGVSCNTDTGNAGSTTGDVIASGTGASTFRVPNGVTLLQFQATAESSENFIVRADGRGIINTILGPGNNPASFDGSYSVTAGALVEVTNATNVSWIASAGVLDVPGLQKFSRSGTGDAVFVLPARSARYTISGTFATGQSNFIVRVGGRSVINEIIGAAGFSGTYAFEPQERVEIVSSSGVQWSFVETN